MKNNILKNTLLDNNEKIYHNFRKIKGKGYFCQILLTTKRIIFLSKGRFMSNGKKVQRKGMNEIDLNTIHHIEYYIEYLRLNIFVRIFGAIIALAGIALAVLPYTPYDDIIPAIPYQLYIGIAFVLVAMLLIFLKRKTLYLKIVCGLNDRIVYQFVANKYNERAISYLAGKIHP